MKEIDKYSLSADCIFVKDLLCIENIRASVVFFAASSEIMEKRNNEFVRVCFYILF